MGGLVAVTGPVGSEGSKVGVGVGDIYPGTLAALGVVSAIHAARRTGHGQFIDVAMYDAILALCETIVYSYARGGIVQRAGRQRHAGSVPFRYFSNQRWRRRDRRARRESLGHSCAMRWDIPSSPTTIARARNRRVANAEFVRGVVRDWTASHSTREVVATRWVEKCRSVR